MVRIAFCVVSLVAALVGTASGQPEFQLKSMATGAKSPVYLTSDGTSRLFVVEEPGTIRILGDGALKKPAFLDIRKEVYFQGECGLLSMAFHPQFAQNGYFYVDFDERNGKQIHTVIAEFKVSPSSEAVDPTTERRLFTVDQPFPNHKGGQLQFGPDGMLYIAMGDGGLHDDPHANGQNKSVLLGKLLRIDVNSRSPYAVPKDNPFVADAEAKPEIWAYGLRNPWRFSFDRQTGVIYAGDVGQNHYEEVDIIEKGKNYGWRVREGLHPNPTLKVVDDQLNGAAIDPILEYPHTEGNNCIIGGYVYRGKAIPSLVGWYLYADFATGRIWGLRYEDGKVLASHVMLLKQDVSPSSFGEDADGELYICDHGHGIIWKIVPKE